MLVYLNDFFSTEEISDIYNDLSSLKSWKKRPNIQEEYSQLILSKEEEGIFKKFYAIVEKKSHILTSIIQTLYPSSIDYYRIDYLDFFKYETHSSIGVHADTRNVYGYKKFISIIYYLNDNYYGGLFRVYKDDKCVLKTSPKAGDAIILTQDMKHESTKIKNGNKYIALQHWGYN